MNEERLDKDEESRVCLERIATISFDPFATILLGAELVELAVGLLAQIEARLVMLLETSVGSFADVGAAAS